MLTSQEKTKLSNQLRAEYKAGLDYRHGREKAWKEAEDQYFNRKKKSLKQRYNVPVPIVSGFVETLLSKVDDPPTLKWKPGEEADFKAVKKAQALYQQESRRDDYDWEMVDLDGKKLAALSGRSINKIYAESKPKYRSYLEPVDHYDFIASPIGGGNLERHKFVMQDNILKTKDDLKAGVEMGLYDAQAVSQLINATKEDQIVDNDTMYRAKQNRLMALGLDGISYNFAGQSTYKMIEAGTVFNGKRYYALFNYDTGIIVRCEEWQKVFASNLWCWTSWATHRDVFNFWSKSPVDDILPLSDMIRILVNQELDNRLKRNFGMRAFDPDVFPNPHELQWKPDGLVAMKAGSSKVTQLDKAIFEFDTPELQGTINLVNWIDGVIGQKSGITAEAQGQSDEDKVGIYYGNMQQVADRLGLYNKSYKKNWQAIGRRYVWGLHEHLRSPQAVEIIGEKGQEWDELRRIEINPEWDIIAEGGNAEIQADEVKKKQLQETMKTLTEDELAILSPRWRAETKLRTAGVEEDELRMAFDRENEGNREILAEASISIQEILKGKEPKINRGANTAFIQKILDFATDDDSLTGKQVDQLYAYAEQHIEIAQENMARKAVQMMAQRGISPDMMSQQPTATEQLYSDATDSVAPNTPEGTQSQSQQLTPNLNV
jgi:hypothetical protein